jgi:hypothetical protein
MAAAAWRQVLPLERTFTPFNPPKDYLSSE